MKHIQAIFIQMETKTHEQYIYTFSFAEWLKI